MTFYSQIRTLTQYAQFDKIRIKPTEMSARSLFRVHVLPRSLVLGIVGKQKNVVPNPEPLGWKLTSRKWVWGYQVVTTVACSPPPPTG